MRPEQQEGHTPPGYSKVKTPPKGQEGRHETAFIISGLCDQTHRAPCD